MKIIRYKVLTEVNHGTKEDPKVEVLLQEKTMVWSDTNEVIAKAEAHNGEYTIEDDGQPEPEPTQAEQLRADVDELREALNMILTGVTE